MATIDKREMNYRIDFTRMTLIMTAAFADNAYVEDTEEYAILKRLKKDFPDLKIERRTHKTPSKYKNKAGEEFTRNQFKDLSYNRMELFMAQIPNGAKYRAEYDRVKGFATAVNGNGYTMTRRWFVEQFPEFRTNPVFYLKNAPKLVLATQFMDVATEGEKKVVGYDS